MKKFIYDTKKPDVTWGNNSISGKSGNCKMYYPYGTDIHDGIIYVANYYYHQILKIRQSDGKCLGKIDLKKNSYPRSIVINNGVLVFLGNSVPTSTTVISMKEVYIYEGAFGTTTGMLISDISNVNISSPQDGQPLIYDNASQKWIAGTVGKDYIPISTLDTIDDVSLNGLTTGQTIGYDGFKWVPKDVPVDLSDISDVDLSGVATGKAIVWDASLNKWIIGNAGGGSASGVTSTNIQPTVDDEGEPLTGGKLYYDTSWNSFHGRTTEGWQELLLSNTNLLFGAR